MPTKQQLEEKINELEKEKKFLLNTMLELKDLFDGSMSFIKALNLKDLFCKTMDTEDKNKFLDIDEAREAINNVKCVCCENGCDCKK
jgi:hypothetical protein